MQIREGVALKDHSTFHVGGPADFFVAVSSKEELREALVWAQSKGIAWHVIGEGSNILFPDAGVRGLIIKNGIGGITHTQSAEGVTLAVGAGVLLDDAVRYACMEGWWGLENLSAIPGTVGATPVQNVGAYGVEVADRIAQVSVYDVKTDTFSVLSPEDCRFSYRHSLFKEEEGARYVVCEVLFFLSHMYGPMLGYRDLLPLEEGKNTLTPLRVREEVTVIRSKKFPDWHVVGTAGSFFKNPTVTKDVYAELCTTYPELPAHETQDGHMKIALGWVLDHVCGLKGVREGCVGTFAAQALVVVAYEGATAEDIFSFTEKIRTCVEEKCGIVIEREVRMLS